MVDLSNVTLWCYATVFHEGTARALRRCLDKARFAKTIVFTDDPKPFHSIPFDVSIHLVKNYGAGDPGIATAMRRGADMVSVWMLTELPKYADCSPITRYVSSGIRGSSIPTHGGLSGLSTTTWARRGKTGPSAITGSGCRRNDSFKPVVS
jgi:hypothetical protein